MRKLFGTFFKNNAERETSCSEDFSSCSEGLSESLLTGERSYLAPLDLRARNVCTLDREPGFGNRKDRREPVFYNNRDFPMGQWSPTLERPSRLNGHGVTTESVFPCSSTP